MMLPFYLSYNILIIDLNYNTLNWSINGCIYRVTEIHVGLQGKPLLPTWLIHWKLYQTSPSKQQQHILWKRSLSSFVFFGTESTWWCTCWFGLPWTNSVLSRAHVSRRKRWGHVITLHVVSMDIRLQMPAPVHLPLSLPVVSVKKIHEKWRNTCPAWFGEISNTTIWSRGGCF